MKRKPLLLFALAAAALASSLASCHFPGESNLVDGSSSQKFGIFGHGDSYLPEYAVSKITLPEAKALIGGGTRKLNVTPSIRKANLADEDEAVRSILSQYACLTISVNYFVSGTPEQQVREDLYQGTDFLEILSQNCYLPFGQMKVKYLYVNEGLLDGLERENEAFHEDLTNLISPFDNPYTYHIGFSQELVLQTHHFAELPSSVNGGIGATFRQDCELQFDREGKISHWQSSLGLYTSTPTGTMLEGYIFEASFDWTSK